MAKKKSNDRAALIKGIDSPLGFFVLALLIIEAFLTLILTFAELKDEEKPTFIWLGVFLFILVTLIVGLLVWFKPENLTFDKTAHLDRESKQFGTDQQKVKSASRFGNQTTE